MGRGVVATDELVVVLLPAVIRDRVAGDRSAAGATGPGRGGQEEVVHPGPGLELIKDRLNAFVDEGHGADLDRDHRAVGLFVHVEPLCWLAVFRKGYSAEYGERQRVPVSRTASS